MKYDRKPSMPETATMNKMSWNRSLCRSWDFCLRLPEFMLKTFGG
jgi:hypothetical protein